MLCRYTTFQRPVALCDSLAPLLSSTLIGWMLKTSFKLCSDYNGSNPTVKLHIPRRTKIKHNPGDSWVLTLVKGNHERTHRYGFV